jgi:hypothetical protein
VGGQGAKEIKREGDGPRQRTLKDAHLLNATPPHLPVQPRNCDRPGELVASLLEQQSELSVQ